MRAKMFGAIMCPACSQCMTSVEGQEFAKCINPVCVLKGKRYHVIWPEVNLSLVSQAGQPGQTGPAGRVEG